MRTPLKTAKQKQEQAPNKTKTISSQYTHTPIEEAMNIINREKREKKKKKHPKRKQNRATKTKKPTKPTTTTTKLIYESLFIRTETSEPGEATPPLKERKKRKKNGRREEKKSG